jgi:dTDP-4-dehydrorhamnose reductase
MAGKPTILLTGATGYLGHALVAAAASRGLRLRTAGRAGCDVELDLDDPASVEACAAGLGDALLLHAGALASIAACEADPARAERIHVAATRILAAAAGARLLLVSTDLVFDGTRAPYAPQAPPRPCSEYGRSKARAEAAALAAGARVVRLPLLYGPSFDGRRGATDMIRTAHEQRRPLTLYTDEYRTPLRVDLAAERLLDRLSTPGGPAVVHLPGPERLSRAELGRRWCAEQRIDASWIEFAPCRDPLRPRDVSLLG